MQDAHEAIRPTRPKINSPEGLTAEQARLYRLVWSRFAGSQMTASQYERLSMTAEADGFSRPFAATASWRVHRGWEAAFEGIRKEPATAPPSFDAQPGTALTLDSVSDDEENPTLREDETKPPSRYKQHSLVQKMKAEGIGRRPACSPIGVERTNALGDQAADHAVEMAFLGDVERVCDSVVIYVPFDYIWLYKLMLKHTCHL